MTSNYFVEHACLLEVERKCDACYRELKNAFENQLRMPSFPSIQLQYTQAKQAEEEFKANLDSMKLENIMTSEKLNDLLMTHIEFKTKTLKLKILKVNKILNFIQSLQQIILQSY